MFMKNFTFNCNFLEEIREIENSSIREEVREEVESLIEEFIEKLEKLVGEENVELFEATYFTTVYVYLDGELNYDEELEWELEQMYGDLYTEIMNIIQDAKDEEWEED